jgi:[CysO sulfur-carrier protein]-S-L-cysteine hydrolase
MASTIRVRAEIFDAMLQHARHQPGGECCGLLAGHGGIITAIFPAENAHASANAYEIAPRELFALFRRMREERLDHLGIYHSHPAGENKPSARDIEQAFYPEAVYFIISPQPDAPKPIRAFSIREGRILELEIGVTTL